MNRMKVSKSKARIIQTAITHWKNSGALSETESQKLAASIIVEPFDWQRLAKYSMWAAITCVVISLGAVLADKWLMELLEKLFNAPDTVKCLAFALFAAGFYFYGYRRKKNKPSLVYSNEAIFFLGVVGTAVSIFFLGKAIDTGSGHFSLLLLLAAIIYARLGLYLDSILIWIFAMVSLGSWFGAETGYVSGWGAYYFGMNYPLRFVFFGMALTAASYVFLRTAKFPQFHRSTYIIGLLYLFMALWILSIFGNYGNMENWYRATHLELLHWSILFAICAFAAIYHGLKYDNGVSRGFGITFLFINLYTRYFEYFWDTLHKALFFLVLGISLWYVGSKAEKIWSLDLKSQSK